MITLDLHIYGAEQPKEYLFLKNLGISIFSHKQPPTVDGALSDRLFLQVQSSSGKKFIQVDHKDSAFKSDSDAAGFFYFTYLSHDVIEKIKTKMQKDFSYRIYFLCHSFFDCQGEYQKLIDQGIDLTRVSFLISSFGRVSQVLTKKNVQSFCQEISYNEIIFVNPFKKVEKKEKVERNLAEYATKLFFAFLKIVLQPLLFLRIQLSRLKGQNIIILNRIFELFDFVVMIAKFPFLKSYGLCVDGINFVIRAKDNVVMRAFYFLRKQMLTFFYRAIGTSKVAGIKSFFVLRHAIVMSLVKSFGLAVDSYYKSKVGLIWVRNLVHVGLIRFGYLIRHLLLMAGFKSFGVFVDIKNAIEYGFRVFGVRIGYFLRHIGLMSAYKMQGFFVDSFYFLVRICHFFAGIYYSLVAIGGLLRIHIVRGFFAIRHLFLMGFYKTFGLAVDIFYWLRAVAIHAFYFSRHGILMAYYKSYGLVVDFWNLSIRIGIRGYYASKAILWYACYPILKIYWFSRFQYMKRIKKAL